MNTPETDTMEQYFLSAKLGQEPVFCGDERASDHQEYIHLFGGVANIAYTRMILDEQKNPGSVASSLTQNVIDTTKLLNQNGLKMGVHSDTHADKEAEIDISNPDGAIGCGYLQHRQAISEHIGNNEEEIIETLKGIRPELYQDSSAIEKAKTFINTHRELAKRNEIFSPGREAAIEAVKAGAPQMLVKGDHGGRVGIINHVPNSTFDTNQAIEAGQPAYDHDLWAAIEAFSQIDELNRYNPVDIEIASDVDVVGTMQVLGVEDIRIRR